ncbi:hypothetical protein G6F42_016817 [Rhizopus arrhizus]|nr:hypothetical protein G6F42_016817 [Rhizopus arrhizus]
MVQIRRFSTYVDTSAAALRAFESNAQSNLTHKAFYIEYKRIHASLDVPESAIENVNMSIFYLNSIRSVHVATKALSTITIDATTATTTAALN